MEIFLSLGADRQLKKLPAVMYKLILTEIQKLEYSPYPLGAKKLESREGWRIRAGDYRILYTIDKNKKEVTILSVKHRKDAYRYQ
ncbi:hypothetical protein A3D03_01015 [Candidatus Gottesmanbacteria bacterium RIFCSPHIGHO2_02_FULL_40_13]|uniref:Addiction module antitoxin RelB n=1 Tax=Candidatus Gottesmanbacteria bacterium RIFCSPHIGHO2_02_FULL_40_13 TaxID=1798384 RepID=A0A1F6A5R1_9BACT|nr:MAG: hypothetical protein A3D03_01015 [Candidatus Gottesmanbacteria bacterium RIFCSPHIGHO2_02_FULL_40_13]